MKILVVGISVRAMAESAVRSGYSVIALDAYGDQDLKDLTESRSLRHDFHVPYSAASLYEKSGRLNFDSVAYTSNLENHPEIIRRFGAKCRVIGNSPEIIESVRHWATLYEKLEAAGFRVPHTLFAGRMREADPARSWLIRPPLSGGGHGIAFLKRNKAPRDPFFLQEYIPGKPCSASFVANGRECVILGITAQLAGTPEFGAHGFRYCGNVLPLPEFLHPETGVAILDHVRRLAGFLTREHGLIGVNGIDFILSGDQVWLTEVNPRFSASMELVEQAYGLPVFRLHLQAVLECKLPDFNLAAQAAGGEFFGKAILFAEAEAVAPDTRKWTARAIRDVPAPGEILPRGGPICTILAACPTYEETLGAMIAQAGKLRAEILPKNASLAGPPRGKF